MDDMNQQGADSAQQAGGTFQPQTPDANTPPAMPGANPTPGAGTDTSMGQPDTGMGADTPPAPTDDGMPATGPTSDPNAGDGSTPPQPNDDGTGMPPAAPQQ